MTPAQPQRVESGRIWARIALPHHLCVSPSPAAVTTSPISTSTTPVTTTIPPDIHPPSSDSRNYLLSSGMAGIMLRSLASSLSAERTPLPCIPDPLAGIGRASWPPSGTDARPSTGKTKHTPESVRASPYPPLSRSSNGFGSAAGAKRLAAAARATQPLRRTTSLHGGDSLASLQQAAEDARSIDRASCKPLATLHKPRRSSSRPLRASPSLVNTLPLDVLVCPPPAPPPRCDILPHHPVVPVPAPVFVPEPPKPAPKPVVSQPPLRRRSSLAPAPTAPTALVVSRPSQVPLPSPPAFLPSMPKKKREPLAQRMLRRTFERTPRGAHVKVLGAHAAMRMLSEAEEEAAVAASVVVVNEQEEEDVCMSDSWVEVAPVASSQPEPSSQAVVSSQEDMEWSMIEEDEC